MKYGTAHPRAYAEAAAAHGMSALAVTDRDGMYGAVAHAQACVEVGIRPIFGINLPLAQPVEPTVSPRFGATYRDQAQPRVTFLARSYVGWVGLHRLASAHHDGGLTHDRIQQIFTLLAEAEQGTGLTIVLGPQSSVSSLIAQANYAEAASELERWKSWGADLVCELVTHRTDPRGKFREYSTAHAARMLQLAQATRTPAVVTNAVRFLTPQQAPIADVLDATRKLVPLSSRAIERSTSEGYFADATEMRQRTLEIVRAAGRPDAAVSELLYATEDVARRCDVDVHEDCGIGSVRVPELDVILDPSHVSHLDVSWSSPVRQRRTSAVISAEARRADSLLRERCEAGLATIWRSRTDREQAVDRLEQELAVVSQLGFASYFLTVDEVVKLARQRSIRVAARGSGAGSLINHLLGISVLNPLDYGLLMERFLSPLRSSLPDIDIDVESHRRLEMYEAIFQRFGAERVACVAMFDTYRVRHAIRDVGSALALPRAEVDAFAKAFPRIRARDVRGALQHLPELRRSGFGALARSGELDHFLQLVEGLDGLPRNVALHPCGVVLSDSTLLDRTPTQMSNDGFALCHYDKDDVETMGLLKLDVLGIRMQSAMSHAVKEIERTTAQTLDIDRIDFADAPTFELIQSTQTLGCFQIESPGQRELIGKFAPETFDDIIIDISLFRPGPVKSDMITPFLEAKHGWKQADYLHPRLRPILWSTRGVVVFHEQVIDIVAEMTGCSRAEADEMRRGLGSWDKHDYYRGWFYPLAISRDFDLDVVDRVWEVLRAFASFGFCKAHAGAFAVPTYQSAWLKTHHPAAFYAGVLTHDPGMYPRRLILEDARTRGIPLRSVDINRSIREYQVEDCDGVLGIRIGLMQVKGISESEISSIVEGQPFIDLADVYQRAQVSVPTLQSLILAGALDGIHGIGQRYSTQRGTLTRRDLLVHLQELHHWRTANARADEFLFDNRPTMRLTPTGLPDLTESERVQMELDILGMDVSHHVMDFHQSLLNSLQVVKSADLLNVRSGSEILVAGVKVATQTPPVRSGKRVIFITLDDGSGPVDAALFEDHQGEFAQTMFSAWTVLLRGVIRRTGPRGVSLRATGCWNLMDIDRVFTAAATTRWGYQPELGRAAVLDFIAPQIVVPEVTEEFVPTRGNRRMRGGMSQGNRPVLVHPSGYKVSPYTGVTPASTAVAITPSAKLWHTSPGTPG